MRAFGAGGQDFGAFYSKRINLLELTGDSNDYLGKGLSGGKIIVRHLMKLHSRQEDNIIIGNVALCKCNKW